MDSAEALQRRIKSTHDLGSVVRTMKALAAVSVRHYEEAVASLAAYTRTIELALQALARQIPEETLAAAVASGAPGTGSGHAGDLPEGAIVLGTDQGMCGTFNDQMAQYVRAVRAGPAGRPGDGAAAPRPGPVWAVGVRLVPALREAGLEPEAVFAAPGSAEGITGKVSELLSGLDAWLRGAGLGTVRIYHQRSTGPATYRPRAVLLWPVDLRGLAGLRRRRWDSRSLPMTRLPWEQMLRPIVRQHLFIGLYRAHAESLASENAARLATMERAEKNIAERLQELQLQFNYLRQQSITVELLDIIGGYESLRGRRT